MGSGIAAHLANAGVESLLFDITPGDGDRLAAAKKGIQSAKKMKPPALHTASAAALITPCNYDDQAHLLATCDWIVEVVVERLDIKKKVFEWVATHRAPGSIVSSNTSGIPLADMAADMPAEMRSRFLVTHFFNPVRWMRLLELVAGPETAPEVVQTIADFGQQRLGKGIVFGKDTPNFIANRIGTFGMGSVFRHMGAHGLGVDAIDSIFGPAMGRPKSAVFRTADLVGLDTLVHVFATVYDNAPDDEERGAFVPPDYVKQLVELGATGQKTGAGFYKKARVDGKKAILTLNLETMEYGPKDKPRFASVGKARKKEGAGKKIAALLEGDDAAAACAWAVTADTLIYAANRLPEIADDIVQVDRALRWGFGWDLGPFETWDAIGVRASVDRMKAEGRAIPAWVTAMLDAGRESFYARDGSTVDYWQVAGDTAAVPTSPQHITLIDLRAAGDRELERNPSASLWDLGDGVLGLEFHSKMNALDNLILESATSALQRLANDEFDALVIGNQDGKAFCAGANLLMIMLSAQQKKWDDIDAMLTALQDTMMGFKYNAKPVVTAPYGLTLGGGLEVAMHSAVTVSHGDLFAGQVEVGMGLIPGAGGCKELVMRALGDFPQDIGYDPNPFVQAVFQRIGLAKVTSSAGEAREWGFLRPTDKIVMDSDALVYEAKRTARGLADSGYQTPNRRTAKLPGHSGRAAIEFALMDLHNQGYATDHDVTVGKKLAGVLTGGDIAPNTVVTEQDMLDLEREAFLSLCGDAKTMARIQHFLMNNKPLRN
jgi:3-hydroxyacyl-CoA dehydrogenase